MGKQILRGMAVLWVMGVSISAWASDAATADEAVAKVKAAAESIKAGNDTVLPEYNTKGGKWTWKDSYVFVMDCAAMILKAHPNEQVRGIKLTDLKDKVTGQEFGTALCDAGKKANGGWVEYMWIKPNAEGHYRKIVYVLPAGKYMVAAGIYDDKLRVDDLEARIR